MGRLRSLGLLSAAAQAAPSCEEWHAELLVVEGDVEVQRGQASGWARAVEGDLLCMGDTIRVNDYGRAAVVLPDESLLRLDWSAELTFERADAQSRRTREVAAGNHPRHQPGSAFTELLDTVRERRPRRDRVRHSASPQTRPQAEITVLEGEVVVTNATARVSVPAGAAAAARAEGAPLVTPVAVPVDRMRWASYYRPLLASELPAPDAPASAADAADPDFYAARAAARLRYGRVDEALSDLAEAERLEPGNATAPALTVLIATTHGDKSTALTLAERARSSTRNRPSRCWRLSYAQQALADVAAREKRAPSAPSSLPRAMRSRGRGARSLRSRAATSRPASRARRARPGSTRPSRLRTRCSASLHLRAFDVPSAIRAFERSTALDRSVPLAHLGLGIALIQNGELLAGRRELELAVALGPDDALARSYMGKAYDAERRDESASQLALAKQLDPLDPTPWLYDALRLLDENRPIAGLLSLHEAAERNADRAVFRSRLLMDQDVALRTSGGLGRLHREAGLVQSGFVHAWDSIAADPTNSAAHQLLSDIYSVVPRYEIARVSELHIAQLTPAG